MKDLTTTPDTQRTGTREREQAVNTDGLRPLPKGWGSTTLGEATNPSQKRVNPQNYPDLPYIGMENVEPQTMRLLGTVPACEMRSAADSFSPGDVLYGRLRPYLNKVVSPDFSGLCSTEFIIFRKVPHLHSKYLQYFLNSWDFVQFANSLNAGDRPRVKFEQLASYPFPLPTLPEQERIVARLEELLSDLEAGVAALARVRLGVKRYKASVLKAACEGKLFDVGARGTRPSVQAGRTPSASTGMGGLPEGWRWATLEEIASEANYGTSQKCDYSENEFPVIRIPNIISGDIDLTDLKFAIDGSGLREKDSLMPGDLLIIRTNGSRDLIGKSALIRKAEKKPLYFASYLIRYRIKDFENVGAWVATIWESPFIRTWLEEVVSTTAGQYNLNIAKLNRLPIPLPPPEKQQRIVAEVERRLESARAVESAVEVGLKRAKRLRQAVLRSAFEGRLVS